MHKINTISDLSLPARLQEIPDKPLKLWVRGVLPDDNRLSVSIVGTRKPTSYGREVTSSLAERLAERGVVIVSGLAHGIDGIAHEAALKARGCTVAVLANGLETIYPSAHRQLAERMIAEGGAVISEFEPGTPPLQFRLLQRNRLVSGLSDIVVVTEAGIRSGTMNTVMHALAQGKDVYAVPGPITSPMSSGCNALIAQGATPIVSIEAFIDSVIPNSHDTQTELAMAHTPEEQAIIDLIRGGHTDGDHIQKDSGLEPAVFSQTLTLLEIRGIVKSLGGNHWGL